METPKIEAQKVTKPIQLLAAWLVGLMAIDGMFLGAASQIAGWQQSLLVVAAVLNVPLFLGAIFLLQTKFRPELQEDSFYAKYLDSKTNKIVKLRKDEILQSELFAIKSELNVLASAPSVIEQKESNAHTYKSGLGYKWKIALNDYLPNFVQIRQLLKQKSIPLNDIFGSAYTENKPEKAILTISRELDYKSRLDAIHLAIEAGLDGFNYFNKYEDITEEDILLGSYGYARGYVPFDKAFIELISDDPEPVDLKYFEKNYLKGDGEEEEDEEEDS